MRISEVTVSAVKERADIYDVVADRVELKKQGRDFVGLCPFHEEKSPSFSISPSKQMFFCFGCGAGGDAIAFMQKIGQQSFAEVVLSLAQRYNIPVQTEEPEQQQAFEQKQSRQAQLREVVAIAVNFYEHSLRQPQCRAAQTYLTRDRRFSEATLQQFQIGYAPSAWDALFNHLVIQKHFPVELVEAAGLILPRKQGGGYYDRFRDRIMIPIHDDQGRAIGFGGRALGDEKPKYLNSPETELFDKGKTLFCLDKAKQAIAQDDRAVVVEGYFDAIALHAAGIQTAVASLGTALSEQQIRQLLRYTASNQVVLNFDADAAGVKATNRAIGEVADLAYRGGVQLRILNLPAGKDADDFLKSASPEAYTALLNAAPLWIDWQVDRVVQERNLTQADGYQRAITDLIEIVGRIENTSTRGYYIDRCAEILAGGDARRVPTIAETLLIQVRRSRQPKPTKPTTTEVTPIAESGDAVILRSAEEVILRLYLHCPDFRHRVIAGVGYLDRHLVQGQTTPEPAFSVPHHAQLWQLLTTVQSRPDLNLVAWLQSSDAATGLDRLLHLTEKTAQDLHNAEAVLRKAIAAILNVRQRSRYLEYLRWFETADIATLVN